ncbi:MULTISPECIES: GNAT family N-acetyltransferase [unclassified Saccharothrix]|uniref:GNAT family N-acetyltransferase n=1 Tax=unclassified Saccharothrix TaxID=2593673 RepID=UPI00307DF760
MAIVLGTLDDLDQAVGVLREWQVEGAPMQLHPGDLGWFRRFGAGTGAVRSWRRDGRVLALGLLDGPGLLRLTTAPDVRRDPELARRMCEDIAEPARGVLPEGEAAVDSPTGLLLKDFLSEAGWTPGEPWTPLHRDLSHPVEDPGVRVEVVGPERVAERVAVQRAAFDGSTFSEERWLTMAAGVAYADARCLVAYEQDDAVAAVTVWSAGPGKPGLLEPMGVHRDHRGRGYGKAISVAAAAALRDLGSSSAVVATPSANAGAVATYRSAGFRALPEIRDQVRAG